MQIKGRSKVKLALSAYDSPAQKKKGWKLGADKTFFFFFFSNNDYLFLFEYRNPPPVNTR
jgi:hypothetical protein